MTITHLLKRNTSTSPKTAVPAPTTPVSTPRTTTRADHARSAKGKTARDVAVRDVRFLPRMTLRGGAAATALVVSLAGCATGSMLHRTEDVAAAQSGQSSSQIRYATAAQVNAARVALETLPVKGRASMAGYSRSLFLPHGRWPSTGDGCTVRDQIVRRDATQITVSATRPCHPIHGTLVDPYSGATITLAAAQLDHVAALGNDYVTGAGDGFTPTPQWPTVEALRHAIARDPDNLQMVTGRLNEQKKDADLATWAPPNKAYRCTYAVRILLIKSRYGLWLTPAEKSAATRYLSTCQQAA